MFTHRMFEVFLNFSDGMSYDATDNIADWETLNYAIRRNNLDGVTLSMSTPFKFYHQAYDLLLDEYLKNGIHAIVEVSITRKNDHWEYDEIFRSRIDFTTVIYDNNYFDVQAMGNFIDNIFSSRKNIDYEIPVEEVKEKEPLYYSGIEVENSMSFTMDDDSGGQFIEFRPRIFSYSEEIINAGYIEDIEDPGYIARIIKKPSNLKLLIDLDVYITKNFQQEPIGYWRFVVDLKTDEGSTEIHYIEFNEWGNKNIFVELDLNQYNITPYDIRCRFISVNETTQLESIKTNSIKISYNARRDNPIYIDVVKPITLLNKILEKMGEGIELIGTIDVEDNIRLKNALILPAESIRGIEGAKIITSLKKFEDWLSAVFGYTKELKDNIINYRHRSKFFHDDVMLKIKDHAEFQVKTDKSQVYTKMKVGYDKQDYDNVNGRFEYHFSNTYSTGLTANENKSLDLISPYRADCYGIEFLTHKRGEETTDNSSDKDVFFVGAYLARSEEFYILELNPSVSGVFSRLTIFNTMYSPRSCAEVNKMLIAPCTSYLKFASTDHNNDNIVISGVQENGDITINESDRVFMADYVLFSTPDDDLYNRNMNGLVEVEANGCVFRGYIYMLHELLGETGAQHYELYVKDVKPIR